MSAVSSVHFDEAGHGLLKPWFRLGLAPVYLDSERQYPLGFGLLRGAARQSGSEQPLPTLWLSL